MCGLFGIINPTKLSDIKILENLSAVSTLRGIDSAGFAAFTSCGSSSKVKEEKEVSSSVVRTLRSSAFLPYTVGWKEHIRNNKNLVAVLGHARWATVGEIAVKTAQPIEMGSLIGTHNGTINLFKPEKHNDFFGFCPKESNKGLVTDSMVLYDQLADAKDDKAINSVLSKTGVMGSYALVWVDLDKNKACFLRNKDRPLWFAVKKDATSLVYASEDHFIKFAIERESVNADWEEPRLLAHHKLMEIDLSTLEASVRDMVPSNFFFPRQKKETWWEHGSDSSSTESRHYLSTAKQNGGRIKYTWSVDSRGNKVCTQSWEPDSETEKTVEEKVKGPEKDKSVVFKGREGKTFTDEEEFREHLGDEKCCNCGCTLSKEFIEDLPDIEWDQSTKTLGFCGDCINEDPYGWVKDCLSGEIDFSNSSDQKMKGKAN